MSRLHPLLLFVTSLFAYLLLSGYGIDRGYPTALYGLTRAIVEDHSLSLDGQRDLLGYDYASFGGRIYSDKAPGPALLMIPSYLLARRLSADPNVRFTLTLLMGLTLPAATASLALLLLLRRTGCSSPLLGAWSFALASLFFPYATVGVSDPIATAALAWAYALAIGRDGRGLLLSGALAGFAILCRYQAALLIAPLAIALTLSLRRKALRFLLPLALFVLVILAYNFVLFDDPLTFPTYHWRGRPGQAPTLQMGPPTWSSAFGMTFGPRRGLFIFTPLLLLAPIGLLDLLGRARVTGAILGSALTAYYGYLLCNRGWLGGADFGLRYSLLSLPLLWLLCFSPTGRIATRVRWALLLPSFAIALLGALGGPYVPFREPRPMAAKAVDLIEQGPHTIFHGTPRGPQ